MQSREQQDEQTRSRATSEHTLLVGITGPGIGLKHFGSQLSRHGVMGLGDGPGEGGDGGVGCDARRNSVSHSVYTVLIVKDLPLV